MTVVTARVFYVVSAFFYFHPQYQGRRHLRFHVICEPRGAHLLMLQGREINLLFLSPAPGIEPGSAGVRLQCFTHWPPGIVIHLTIMFIFTIMQNRATNQGVELGSAFAQ